MTPIDPRITPDPTPKPDGGFVAFGADAVKALRAIEEGMQQTVIPVVVTGRWNGTALENINMTHANSAHGVVMTETARAMLIETANAECRESIEAGNQHGDGFQMLQWCSSGLLSFSPET